MVFLRNTKYLVTHWVFSKSHTIFTLPFTLRKVVISLSFSLQNSRKHLQILLSFYRRLFFSGYFLFIQCIWLIQMPNRLEALLKSYFAYKYYSLTKIDAYFFIKFVLTQRQ